MKYLRMFVSLMNRIWHGIVLNVASEFCKLLKMYRPLENVHDYTALSMMLITRINNMYKLLKKPPMTYTDIILICLDYVLTHVRGYGIKESELTILTTLLNDAVQRAYPKLSIYYNMIRV